MQQYEIEFYGSGIDVMASAITNEQAEYIRKFLKIRAYDNIDQVEKELKYIGIDTSKADILNFYKMLYND
jgi:hypothetical protein